MTGSEQGGTGRNKSLGTNNQSKIGSGENVHVYWVAMH